MEKSKVLSQLHEGWVQLEFTKADGSMRQMMATLKADQLPVQTAPAEGTTPRKINPDILAVWDVMKQGWRSFRWDSLKTVNGAEFGKE